MGLAWKEMTSLTNAPFLEILTIHDVIGDAGLTRRLREMGFHSGCEIKILGRAPFNGPYVVQLHDSVLALRRAEAECLLIK
jgi:ferrous iron transport protein A